MAEKSKKPITDIQKPGKTPAGATSRPIIVGHGTPLKDPMVTDDSVKTGAEAPSKLTKAPSKVLKPISQPDSEPAKAEHSDAPATDSSVSDQAVVDAVVGRAGDKKQVEKDADELHKRLELVEQLVASKKYFVPIDVAAKKRTHRIELAMILLLILIIGGAVYAIDAELVETSIKLPFDLVK